MTSREECEKAYLYLLKHCYEATKKNDTYDFAPSGFKESEVFKQLIEEHFELAENTEEYKHFKLHSDSSLKNLTKVELIDYIKMLYHNWGVADEQLAHSLNAYNNLEEKYKSIDFTLDKQFEHIEEIEKILDVCGIVAIKERIKELTNIKPYKFKELKPNMWVWDDIEKLICQIRLISKNAIHRKYIDGTISDSPFEENRFLPVQCANLEIEN